MHSMKTRVTDPTNGMPHLPDLVRRLKQRGHFRIALCIPIDGLVGIWGPSALAAAKLAVWELNQNAGIAGYPCELTLVNATDDDDELETNLGDLITFQAADAVVGMHISSVRDRVSSVIAGKLPFVYSCMHEGGRIAPGVFAIGETTEQQLRPAISWVSDKRRAKRWVFIGNDYIWPRVSNGYARRYVQENGGTVLTENYVPLGTSDFSRVIEQLRILKPDAVLVSLVGQDQVEFNRLFGRSRLSSSTLRLSCTVTENELLAIGAENTDELLVSASYFEALNTDANLSFKERYHKHYGSRAPALNNMGESTYEGVHFLASLFDKGGAGRADSSRLQSLVHSSAREGRGEAGHAVGGPPIYMAVADGHRFSVMTQL